VGIVEASDWIALAAVLVAPAAALAGAALNAYLGRRAREVERAEQAREDALAALGHMKAVLADLSPTLILNNELREYADPKAAIDGLYKRWLNAREPLILLSTTHPSAEVRDSAFDLQAQVEASLRMTAKAVDGGSQDGLEEWWGSAGASALRLGQLLSPFDSRASRKADTTAQS
jgi:hypothetical protein